jgi:hypothetical protein
MLYKDALGVKFGRDVAVVKQYALRTLRTVKMEVICSSET